MKMKKYAVMLAALFTLGAAAGELTIYGDFPEPRKPGQPPRRKTEQTAEKRNKR